MSPLPVLQWLYQGRLIAVDDSPSICRNDLFTTQRTASATYYPTIFALRMLIQNNTQSV